MSTDLRVGFKERHRKHLHEAIDMIPPPTKKACLEKAREKPGKEVPPMLVPLLDTVGPNSVPTAKKEVSPTLGGASDGTTPVEVVLDQKDTYIRSSSKLG